MPLADRKESGPRYRNQLDKDDARRGREETTISIRKDKRNEQLQKKRFGGPAAMMMPPDQSQQSVGSQARYARWAGERRP